MALSGGFLLGKWAPVAPPPAELPDAGAELHTERPLTTLVRPVALPEAPQAPAEMEAPNPGSPAPAQTAALPVPGDWNRTLRRALDSNDPVERHVAFAQILAGLNEDTLAEALAALEGRPPSREREEQLQLLLYRWASMHGTAAMEYIQGMDRPEHAKTQLAFHAMSGWATTDADGALAWAQSHFEGEENPYLHGIVDGLAKSDLSRASRVMETLPYGRVRGLAVDTLIDGYLQRGNAYAIRWAENLAEAKLREGVVAKLAARMARDDVQAAADWVIRLDNPAEQARGVATVTAQWGARDPEAAAEWVMSIEDEATRKNGLARVVSMWVRREPAAAAEWLNQYPDAPEFDHSAAILARRYQREDPQTALSWAASINDEEIRYRMMQGILNDWQKRDPEGSKAFLEK